MAFESAWKLGRDILAKSGIVAPNPRSVVKELFKENFIQNGEVWIQMLDDRDLTLEIYDEKEARAVYDQIKRNYYNLLDEFRRKMLPVVDEIKE